MDNNTNFLIGLLFFPFRTDRMCQQESLALFLSSVLPICFSTVFSYQPPDLADQVKGN